MSAERDVVFKLTASADPKALSEAKAFESFLLGTQKRVFKSQEDFDRERIRIGKEANKALIKYNEEYKDAILKDAEVARSFVIRMAQATAKELNRIDAAQMAYEKAERGRQRGARERAEKEAAQKAESDAKASLAKRLSDFKAAKRGEERILRESLKRQSDDEKAAAKFRVALERANAAVLAEEERRIAANRAAIGSQGRANPVGAVKANNPGEASRVIREQFSEMGESIMRITRGITAFGLVGEKDIDKVRDALLSAQSAFDVFGGSLKVINKLERAWDAYRKTILAATAAQAAHGAVSNASSFASLGAGAASLLGIGASRAAAVEAAKKTSNAIGGGLGLGSYAAPVAGAGAGAGAAGGGSAAMGLAGGAAIIGSVAALATLVRDIVAGKGTIKSNSISGGLLGNSYLRSFSGAADLMMGNKSTAAAQSVLSDRATDKSQKMSVQIRERNSRLDDLMSAKVAERSEASGKVESLSSQASAARIAAAKSSFDITNQTLGVEAKIASIRSRMNTASTSAAKVYLATQLATEEALLNQLTTQKTIADDAAKISEINAQRSAEEKRIYALRKQVSTLGQQDKGLSDSLKSEMEASANKMLALTQQRGEVEKSIAQTRAASARTALESAQKELETVTSRIKSEHDALKSAEERFGLMSRSDQTEVMDLLLKARAGKQLDAGQVTKLKSLGTMEAERLASAQARNLAKGDYSKDAQALSAIDEANRRLGSRVLDITQGKTNRWGVNPGSPRMLSKKQKADVEAAQYAIEANERRAEQIRLATARDAALRRSIFGEERSALSASLSQKGTIEARISQQLTIVAKFENTAKEVADMAVRQLQAAQAPWMAEFQRQLQVTIKDVNNLQKQRIQTAPGRS